MDVDNNVEAEQRPEGEPLMEVGQDEAAAEPSKRKKIGSRNAAGRKKQKLSLTSIEKNAVMLLHEKFPEATYSILSQSGPVHQPIFTMEVKVNGQVFLGTGQSKKSARLVAAETAVDALNLKPVGGVTVAQPDIDMEINFAADDLSLLMQPSTSAGFAASRPPAVPAVVVKKIPEPIGKSPLLILNELRPGQQFDWRCVDETPVVEKEQKEARSTEQKEARSAGQKYACVLNIDGQIFEEVGNKKVAKAKVAGTALKLLYGLEFVYTSEGVPVFQGDDSLWTCFKVKEEEVHLPAICNGKNPIQMLNELYPTLSYEEITVEDDVKAFNKKFCIALPFEGRTFMGEGNSKKLAKTRCALAVVEALEKNGTLKRKMAEKTVKKKSKHNSSNWSSQGKPGSNIIKLAVHFPELEYRLTSQTNNWITGQTMYTVEATVRGETFVGTGNSEIGAKDMVAENVLNKFRLFAMGYAKNDTSRVEPDSSTQGSGFVQNFNGRGRGGGRGFQRGGNRGGGRGNRGAPSGNYASMGYGSISSYLATGPSNRGVGFSGNRGGIAPTRGGSFGRGSAFSGNDVGMGGWLGQNKNNSSRGVGRGNDNRVVTLGRGQNSGLGGRGISQNTVGKSKPGITTGFGRGSVNLGKQSNATGWNPEWSNNASGAKTASSKFISPTMSTTYPPNVGTTVGVKPEQNWNSDMSSSATYYSSIGYNQSPSGYDQNQPIYESSQGQLGTGYESSAYPVDTAVEYSYPSGYTADSQPGYTTEYSTAVGQGYSGATDSYDYENQGFASASAGAGYLNYTTIYDSTQSFAGGAKQGGYMNK